MHCFLKAQYGACTSCKTRWTHSLWLVHLREAIYADPLPPDWTAWLPIDGPGLPDLDILGALDEMAYGKVAGLPKAQDDTDKTHELGSVHVRTVLARNARLIIRPSDPSGAYVLAIPWLFVGWMTDTEAKSLPQYCRTVAGRAPAWCVPQEALHPFPVSVEGEARPVGA
jgi:hypothetical protein